MDECPRNEEWIVKGVSIWRQSGPEAAPVIATDRPRLDAETAARVVAYLEQGTVLVRISGWRDDVLAPGAGRVGMSISTDGGWIWDASLRYYVEHHLLSPGTEFLDYLSARNFAPRHPSVAEIAEARATLRRTGEAPNSDDDREL